MYPFQDDHFAVRNGWYVAGFAEDLTDKPIDRTIVGMPVALYRKEDGTAVAVGGRCPHRSFPLGKGCVKGDSIVCGYHGISFGPDGKCTSVPSQGNVPPTYRIPTYPLVEHGMWLWIWPGDPELADEALLPDLAEIGVEGCGLVGVPLFTDFVNGRYQLLNDNLLDLTHIAYLHAANIGTEDNATVPEELTQEERVLRSRRFIVAGEPNTLLRETFGHTGLVDHTVGMDFYLPGFHAGIGDNFYSHDDPERHGQPIQRSRVFHAITPATETTSWYFFGVATESREAAEAARGFLRPVIDEDIFATEEIERMIALSGGRPGELLIKSDRTAVTGRRMLEELMRREAGGAPAHAAEVAA